jgi:hypothetical protein
VQTVNQSVEIASYVTDQPRKRVAQMARALVDAEILPKSSGRDIKKITAAQLLPLLAAVALADRVAEAPRVAAEFMALPAHFPEDGEPAPEGDAKLLPAVFGRLMPWLPDDPCRLKSIEFSRFRAGYAATINVLILPKSDDEELLEMELPFWRARSWGGFAKRSFVISPEGCEIMRNLFRRSDIEGMSFSAGFRAGAAP